MSSATATIKFTVGGTEFEFFKSLLEKEKFKDTELAKKADADESSSEDGSSESSSPIVFNRDPVPFQYIKSYMLDDCEVYLSEPVTKLDFLKELEFFGFKNFDVRKIHSDEKVIDTKKRAIEDMENELDRLEAQCKRLKEDIGMKKVALRCFEESNDGNNTIICVNYNKSQVNGVKNVHQNEQFKELCKKDALLRVDDKVSTAKVVYLTHMTNSKDWK